METGEIQRNSWSDLRAITEDGPVVYSLADMSDVQWGMPRLVYGLLVTYLTKDDLCVVHPVIPTLIKRIPLLDMDDDSGLVLISELCTTKDTPYR